MVGAGAIARHHLRSVAELADDVKVRVVCDAVEPACEALATEAGASGGSVATLADHRSITTEQADAAIIALPHDLHAPVAMDLVRRGVHVLVEKPVTCTVAEAQDLAVAAREAGVVAMAGMVRRFSAAVADARAWLADDEEHFGTLRSFDLQVWQNIEGYVGTVGPGHWLLDGARAGGGIVMSVAIHQLDLLRHLTGADVEEVVARGRFDPPLHGGAESSVSALLMMTNGATGTLHATYTAPRVPYCEAFTLFGSSGTLTMHADEPGTYHGPLRVASVRGRSTDRWAHQFEGFATPPPATVDRRDPFTRQLAAFLDAVNGVMPNVCTVDDQHNTLATIEAIATSLRDGAAVRVATKAGAR